MNTNKTFAEKIASEYAHKETRKVVALKNSITAQNVPQISSLTRSAS